MVAPCLSRDLRACSVSIISRLRASYCSWEILPSARAWSACFCASFKEVNLFFVSSKVCPNSLCFCEISSVLPGSSLRSLLTSRSSDWVCFISVLTCFKAVCNLVVSPPISTVIPFILFANISPPL